MTGVILRFSSSLMNSLFSVMTGDLLNLLLNLQKQILRFYFRRERTFYLGVKITIKIDNVDRDFEERLVSFSHFASLLRQHRKATRLTTPPLGLHRHGHLSFSSDLFSTVSLPVFLLLTEHWTRVIVILIVQPIRNRQVMWCHFNYVIQLYLRKSYHWIYDIVWQKWREIQCFNYILKCIYEIQLTRIV